MKVLRFIPLLFCLMLFNSCDMKDLNQAADLLLGGTSGASGLTNLEMSQGLKEALNQGLTKGVEKVSQDGGYLNDMTIKILFPEQAMKIKEKLDKNFVTKKLVDDLVVKMNNGAEEAAKKATPIFVNAIKEMSFSEVTNVLMGEKNAASNYFKKATNQQLYNEFNPVIKNILGNNGTLKHWNNIVSTYNGLTGDNMNPNLDDWVTQKAIEGLFVQIEKEEANIRQSINARTSSLMQKVFAAQDKK